MWPVWWIHKLFRGLPYAANVINVLLSPTNSYQCRLSSLVFVFTFFGVCWNVSTPNKIFLFLVFVDFFFFLVFVGICQLPIKFFSFPKSVLFPTISRIINSRSFLYSSLCFSKFPDLIIFSPEWLSTTASAKRWRSSKWQERFTIPDPTVNKLTNGGGLRLELGFSARCDDDNGAEIWWWQMTMNDGSMYDAGLIDFLD